MRPLRPATAHRTDPVRIRFAIVLIAGVLALTGAGATFGTEIAAVDDAGTRLTLAQPARRIVSLSPHLTELVYAAGAGDRLVGVSRYSDHPAAARALPGLSDAFTLNLEAIRAARPDLVLVWQSGTAQRSRDALKAMAQREGFAVWEGESRDVENFFVSQCHGSSEFWLTVSAHRYSHRGRCPPQDDSFRSRFGSRSLAMCLHR